MNTDLPASPEGVAAPLPTPSSTVSPLASSSLRQLFLQPRKFFADVTPLSRRLELMVVVYLIGITGALDRLEDEMLRASLKEGGLTGDGFLASLHQAWLPYWGVVLSVAVLIGAVHWLISGWFYGSRLVWSGARDMDPALARRVWAYSNLPESIPLVLLAVSHTLLYSSHRAAWAGDEWIAGTVALVAVVWSCWTGYVGATTVFPVRRVRAVFWLLIAPLVTYSIIIGAASMILAGLGFK